jgi:hypothetical protein
MIADAVSKEFTHLLLLSEEGKVCDGMLLTPPSNGPTAFLKLSSTPGAKYRATAN